MPKALKTPAEKAAYAARLEAIRPYLPAQASRELAAFCRYTQRQIFTQSHVHNVLRQPVRRYDDAILLSLEAMTKSFNKAA